MSNLEKTLEMLEDIVVECECLEFYRNSDHYNKAANIERVMNNLRDRTKEWRTWVTIKEQPSENI